MTDRAERVRAVQRDIIRRILAAEPFALVQRAIDEADVGEAESKRLEVYAAGAADMRLAALGDTPNDRTAIAPLHLTPAWLTPKIQTIITGALARREWLSVTTSAVLMEIPADKRSRWRPEVTAYLRETFTAAGAGRDGRWS